MILDATAGNRHIWGNNKHPEGIIFLDKEPNLKIPVNILATWDKIPFRDDCFSCVIFDPPHCTHFGDTSIHLYPKEDSEVRGTWWGRFKGKGELVREIYKAQKEFARVSSRLCFKWNDTDVSLEQILTLFDKWLPVWIQPYNSNIHHGANSTFWVKMVRRENK